MSEGPLYAVHDSQSCLYETRSLRRAWEACRFFQEKSWHREASIFVPDRVDYDTDGINDEEQDQLDEWDSVSGMPVLRLHLCLAPEDDEMARRAAESARAA